MLYKEEIVKFGAGRNLVGTLTYSTTANQHLPTIVLLNAGLTHRTGPNRIYVKLARQLCTKGFSTFRFDFGGIGDSTYFSIPDNTDKQSLQDAREALDHLAKWKKVDNFILIGICSGAETAFELAVACQAVSGVVLINGTALDPSLVKRLYPDAKEKISGRYYRKSMFKATKWLRFINHPQHAVNWLGNRLKNKFPKKGAASPVARTLYENTIQNLEKLGQRKTNVYLLLSEGSTAVDLIKMTYLPQLGHFKDNLKFEIVNNVDHVFTMQWSQNVLINKIENWLGLCQKQIN